MLLALGALPRRTPPSDVRRVGVLRTAAIGDTLLLSGVLRDLRTALPSADIVLVTGRDNAEAGALVADGLTRHVVISVRNPATAIAALRRERLDLLIDTGSWPRFDALLAALGGARFTIGFRTAGQHRHYAYDRVVDHSSELHESANFQSLLRAAGFVTGAAPAMSSAALPPLTDVPARQFIVLHAWSGGYRGYVKEWPVERWVELTQRLSDVCSTFVITGSAAEAQASKGLADRISAGGVQAVSVAGRLKLAEVGTLARESLAVVSVNTGVMHLAALLGAATVALDGPSPPRRWGALGPRVAVVTSTLPGCGYLNLGFEYDGQRLDCMTGISVAAVESAVRNLIGARTG